MLLYVCQDTFRICSTCVAFRPNNPTIPIVGKSSGTNSLSEASYDQACAITGLDRLDNRRVELRRRFAMNLINSKAFFD